MRMRNVLEWKKTNSICQMGRKIFIITKRNDEFFWADYESEKIIRSVKYSDMKHLKNPLNNAIIAISGDQYNRQILEQAIAYLKRKYPLRAELDV